MKTKPQNEQLESIKKMHKTAIKEAFEQGRASAIKDFEVLKQSQLDKARASMKSDILKEIEDLNGQLRHDNTIWRLNGDELNDLWEERLKQSIQQIDSQVTDNQNRVQKPSSDGSQKLDAQSEQGRTPETEETHGLSEPASEKGCGTKYCINEYSPYSRDLICGEKGKGSQKNHICLCPSCQALNSSKVKKAVEEVVDKIKKSCQKQELKK